MPSKRIDHRGHTGSLPPTTVIKVQHALNGSRLQAINETPRCIVERTVLLCLLLLRRVHFLRVEVDDLITGLDSRTVSLDGADAIFGLAGGFNFRLGRARVRFGGEAGRGDGGLREIDAESEGHNFRDVGVWPVDFDRDTE